MRTGRQMRWWTGAGVTVAAAALSGCGSVPSFDYFTPAQVDPKSPVAAKVREAARANYAYPSFRDVPPRPINLPAPEAWKAAVTGLVGERRDMRDWVEQHPAMVDDTEGFAASSRAQIPADVATPIDAGQSTTETFAAEARRKAAAPAPPR